MSDDDRKRDESYHGAERRGRRLLFPCSFCKCICTCMQPRFHLMDTQKETKREREREREPSEFREANVRTSLLSILTRAILTLSISSFKPARFLLQSSSTFSGSRPRPVRADKSESISAPMEARSARPLRRVWRCWSCSDATEGSEEEVEEELMDSRDERDARRSWMMRRALRSHVARREDVEGGMAAILK